MSGGKSPGLDGPNGGAGGGTDGAGQFFPYSPAPRIKLSGFPVAQVRALFSDLRHLCTDLLHRAAYLHHNGIPGPRDGRRGEEIAGQARDEEGRPR